jgi:outer membrane biosynthesis protein TonB
MLATMTRVAPADWPEARRNVERALLKLADLREKKAEAEKRKQKKSDPRPKPKPRPEPRPEERTTESEADLSKDPQVAALSPEQVARILDKLAEKEREKLALRRAHRQTQKTDVERDW